MLHIRWTAATALTVSLLITLGAAPPKLVYVKKATVEETTLASLEATGLPSLRGTWYSMRPFNNPDNRGLDTVYPPEKAIDLQKTYPGKDGVAVAWKEFPNFQVGRINDLKRFPQNDHSCIYLFHELEVKEAITLPVSLGSDDGMALWLKGERLLVSYAARPAAPDQDHATLKLQPGKNRLLVKVCNIGGDWAFYVRPGFPPDLEAEFINRLVRDFPVQAPPGKPPHAAEAVHYRLVTVPVPSDIVLEVGGLGFRPDGKLFACTRRGEVWLITSPEAEEAAKV